MMTPSLSENAALATDVSNSPLALRIGEAGKPTRTVPLTDGKCTIGSGPKCHVCLSHPEVQPLHCVIVQRNEETVVTRWSAGCQLNGRDFSTSLLHAGDCITLGSVVIEVVPVAERVVPRASEIPESSMEPGPRVEQASSEQRLKYLAKAKHIARTRCRGLMFRCEWPEMEKLHYAIQAAKLESELAQHGSRWEN